MNEWVKDLIYSVIFITVVMAIAYVPSCDADEVYMQLLSPKAAVSSVRTLSTDSRMTVEECLEQKERVEAPLSTGGGYSVPSGWVVECIPVDYLDD